MHACTCNARSHALYEVYALYPRRIAPIKKSDVCYIRQPEFSKRLTLTTTLLLPLKLFHGCDCISIHTLHKNLVRTSDLCRHSAVLPISPQLYGADTVYGLRPKTQLPSLTPERNEQPILRSE